MIVCVTDGAALKLEFTPAFAVTMQIPVMVNVTTLPAKEQAPVTLKIGVTPDAISVTEDIADTESAYVPSGSGLAGIVEVNVRD